MIQSFVHSSFTHSFIHDSVIRSFSFVHSFIHDSLIHVVNDYPAYALLGYATDDVCLLVSPFGLIKGLNTRHLLNIVSADLVFVRANFFTSIFDSSLIPRRYRASVEETLSMLAPPIN